VIYLDHNATTPVLPEVREAMLPYLGEECGNPSSSYRFGSHLKSKIEAAREQVAVRHPIEYMVMGMIDNVEIGVPSDIVSIVFGG